MKLIFWNTHDQQDISIFLDILTFADPDIFFLAEYDWDIIKPNLMLFENIGFEHYENPGCSKILIIKKKNLILNLNKQASNYTALREPQSGIVLIAIHMPSQMYSHMDSLTKNMGYFRGEIDEEFGNSIDNDILIIGDFNVNPFEKPMLDFDGFGASNSIKMQKIASHSNSKFKKELYYNPTWKLFENNDFPGTKYFKRPSASVFDIIEYHFLDQVVLSHSLSQKINTEEISTLRKTFLNEFYDEKKNRIKKSDHLPLLYEYKLN